MIGDLTTLASVKSWRSPPIASTADDAQVGRAITAASRFLCAKLQRTLVPTAYVERRDGNGRPSMLLRNGPVLAINSVTIGRVVVPPATGTYGAGYLFGQNGDPFDPDSQTLYLRGYEFCRGFQNVAISYTAGLQIAAETQTIPSAAPWQIPATVLTQLLSKDAGVAYAGGAAFTQVSADPYPGQYIAPSGPDGTYTFSSSDAGKQIAITYGYTPRDIEEACILSVVLEYNRRDRIGANSKSLAGENVTFNTATTSFPAVEERLWAYRNVVPLT